MSNWILLYEDLVVYFKNKNWNLGKNDMDVNRQATFSAYRDCIEINIYRSPCWKNLLEKYSEHQLIIYFLEFLKKNFPKYKGLKIVFSFDEFNRNNCIEKII